MLHDHHQEIRCHAPPGSVTGHASASGLFPADVEFLNREVGAFLDGVACAGPEGRTY